MRNGRFAAICLCAAIAGLGGGCGYKAGSLMPDGVRTVHIRIVDNDTFWHKAEKADNLPTAEPLATPRPAYPMTLDLTERLKNEVLRRTPLRLAGPDAADSVLEATISAVKADTRFRDAADEIQAQRVSISVDFVWRERRTGRVLAQGRGIKRPTDFIVNRGENFTTAARSSLDYIAERVLERMQQDF